jgi:nonribosomal peptide synthetase DhbF
VLAGLWQELLGVTRVGRDDNFFNLGGHSLLAIQLVNRVRDIWSVDLPLATIFESPTVRGMADRLAEGRLQEINEALAANEEGELDELLQDVALLAENEIAAALKEIKAGDAR